LAVLSGVFIASIEAMKKTILLSLATVLTSSAVLGANNTCTSFYENSSRVQAKTTLSAVSSALKASPADIKIAKETLDSLNIVEMEKKVISFEKDLNELAQFLTRDEIQAEFKNIGKSKFFMGAIHEVILDQVLPTEGMSKTDYESLLLVLKSDLPADIEFKKLHAQKIMDRLKYYRYDESTSRGLKDAIVNQKKTSYRLRSLSDKALGRQLAFIQKMNQSPATQRVLSVMLEHAMYDMVKVAKARHDGRGTETIGMATNVLTYGSSMASALIGSGAWAFASGAIDAGPIGIMIIGAATTAGYWIPRLGIEIAKKSKYDDDRTNDQFVGSKITRIPKESVAFWRRWTQRSSVGEKSAETILTEQQAKISQHEAKGAESANLPIFQIKRDLVQPVTANGISTWGTALNTWANSIVGKAGHLNEQQNDLVKEFYRNRDALASLPPKSVAAESLVKRNKEIESLIEDTQISWNTLALEVMTLSYSLDQYKAKAEIVKNEGRLSELYLNFLEDKIVQFDSSRKVYLAIADKIQSRISFTLSFLTETGQNQMARNIDEILKME
jgi:hypothetical protein